MLDVGCGTGINAKELRSLLPASSTIDALDLSPTMVYCTNKTSNSTINRLRVRASVCRRA